MPGPLHRVPTARPFRPVAEFGRFRLVVLGLLAALLSFGPAQAAFPRPADPDVARLDEVPADSQGRLPVVLETSDASALTARIEELGGTVTWVFENIDGMSALVPPEALPVLLADDRVGTVHRQRYVRRAVVAPELPTPLDGTRRRLPGGEIVPWEVESRVDVRTLDVTALEEGRREGGTIPGSFLGYDHVTGAAQSWEVTGYGAGVTVAIIDTGVYPDHPLYAGNVVGGINLVPVEEEQAIDLDHDGTGDGRSFDWDAIENHGHGTFVAGLIAGHAALEFDDETDPFLQSVAFHSPESVEFDGEGGGVLYLMGTAPGADLYGAKVFPYDGGSAPDARVAEAIDRLITMRHHGELDVDVINMSLSGPVLFDGWNPLDMTVAKATFFGITVVSAAANDGPALVTVGSPGSAFTGLTAGAALDPIHTRVAIETFFGQAPGFGNLVYPHDELQVADFSARGLTGDGRVKPDLLATGFLVFSSTLFDFTGDGINDAADFGFSAGTSFSTPTIAGAAALVTAWADLHGGLARAPFVENVLKRSGVPIDDRHHVSQREQGRGFVNIPGAIELMEDGHVWGGGHGNPSHHAKKNLNLASGSVSGSCPPLASGHAYNFLVRIPDGVSSIDFQLTDVTLTGSPNPVFGDGLLVTVHSAKRGGAGDYVYGDTVGEAGAAFHWPFPEAGVARVTMQAPFPNAGEVSGGFTMTADFDEPAADGGETFEGVLRRDEIAIHAVEVPDGLDAVAIRLSWQHDWSRFPTYDLDLFVVTPEGAFPVGTIDSPETAWIEDPPAGDWTFYVSDYSTVLHRERYRLEVAFFEPGIVRELGQLDDVRPRLIAATPNPVRSNATTELKFVLPQEGPARVSVYDVAGRSVRTLANGPLAAGEHVVRWDGRSGNGRPTAAGVYFVRLETPGGTSTRKLVKLK